MFVFGLVLYIWLEYDFAVNRNMRRVLKCLLPSALTLCGWQHLTNYGPAEVFVIVNVTYFKIQHRPHCCHLDPEPTIEWQMMFHARGSPPCLAHKHSNREKLKDWWIPGKPYKMCSGGAHALWVTDKTETPTVRLRDDSFYSFGHWMARSFSSYHFQCNFLCAAKKNWVWSWYLGSTSS